MDRIGILVIGYNNSTGVKRLLSSLQKVDYYNKDVPLIVSIDYSGNNSVSEVAEEFVWSHGSKTIILHETNLGLKNHIISCGNYLNEYNLDALCVFEDDIYVSPNMYRYVEEAVAFYKNDSKVAGISLYKHEYNINANHPFIDYDDGGDTFFIQYAMSWGQVWLKNQWNDFYDWYKSEDWRNMDLDLVPQNILGWKNSWLKYHILYCIDKDLYFVYPRKSLSTDFSDPGAHNISKKNTSMQVPMDYSNRKEWAFNRLDSTLAVYDSFFENSSIQSFLKLPNLEVDLYGAKSISSEKKYLLTRKKLPYSVIQTWGLYLRPIEANIFESVPGEDLFLYDLNNPIRKRTKTNLKKEAAYVEYDLKGMSIFNTATIKYVLDKVLRFIFQKVKRYLK